MWEGFRMSRQVDCKGAEYAHQNGTSIQDFHASDKSEAAICRVKMYKLQADLYLEELTIEKTWRDIITEAIWLKESEISHIDLQEWVDNMYESISPIFTNLLGRL